MTCLSDFAGTWRPLFEGSEAREFRAVADDIAAAIVDWPTDKRDPSLSSGSAGLAVHFAVRHGLTGAEVDQEQALHYLGEAFNTTGEKILPTTLFGGLAGVGWAGHVVQELLPDTGDEDIVADLDEPLAEFAAGNPKEGDYDLVKGLVGIGCYFLARLPRPAAARGLEAVVDYLARTAEPVEDGITWFTPFEVLESFGRSSSPEGHRNVGLAHGVSGIVAFLAETISAGVAVERASNLLDKASNWVLAQEILPGELRFPAWIDAATGRAIPTRVGWCYGDLGVALALLNAARRIGNDHLAAEALRIGRRVANVRGNEACVNDAGLCHGAAGVAHLFNRIYQASGEAVFAETARFWYRRALQMRVTDKGVAGFRSHFPTEGSNQPWLDQAGLLTGSAGVALAFMAAISPEEPIWDRHLLIAVPPLEKEIAG